MWIYFIAFGLSVGIFLLFNRGGLTTKDRVGRIKLFPIVAACVPPLLVAALRYNVGTDYFATYYTGFYRILAGIDFDQFEVGYWLVNKAVQLFTDNVFVMFAISSLLFVGFSYAAIGALSKNVAFSILLFMLTRYYFIGLNAVRQFIALAIFAFAMRYAIDRDLKRFLLFSCFAVSFHISTVVLIPIYWLINYDAKPKNVAIGCAALLVGGNALLGIVSILIPESSKYGIILSGYGTAGSLFTVGTIGINIFLLIIFYSGYREYRNDAYYRCFLWLQVVATMSTMLLPFVPVIERVYWTFSFFSFISLPYMLRGITSQAKRMMATIVLVAGLGFYMYYDIAILEDHEVVPYDSIVDHQPIPSIEFDFRKQHRLD